jgi:hypothetical protein
MADEGAGELHVAASEQAGEQDGDREVMVADADADVLVTEAVGRRDDQQSGRSMRRQLRRVAGWTCGGLVVIAAGGLLGGGVVIVSLAVGVLVIGNAGLILVHALDLSPATGWGEPVGEPCPGCGEQGLREERVAAGEVNGIVALCTPECGYAEVRADPDGPPSAGGHPWAAGRSGLLMLLWDRSRRRRGSR